MRHGESKWNKLNQFTGWVDIPLTQKGIKEAIEGGNIIKDIPVDVIFMSSLIRSQMTAMLAMSQHSEGKVPVVIHGEDKKLAQWGTIYSEDAKEQTIPCYVSWELNERMYGELQGYNKKRTAEKYGEEKVRIWRRSYSTPPPKGESLEMTAKRTIPYFENIIVPFLLDGKNVFVSAHGNSLRSIIMDLDHLDEEEVVALEIPTGKPIIYDFENGTYTKR